MPRPQSKTPSTSICVRLPQQLIAKIDTTANTLYRTKASVIIEALDQYFARMPDKKTTTLDD